MSGFTSKQMKGSNCNELLPNADGSINVRESLELFGEEVHDIRDESVAGGSFDTQVYTVPSGKNFEFTGILGSSSALVRVLIEYSLDGSVFTELSSRYNDKPPGIDCNFTSKTIPTGGKVRLTRSNRQNANQPANISTTILGALYNVI